MSTAEKRDPFICSHRTSRWLIITMILLIIWCTFLRFYRLEEKVYSFDGTYTSTYIYNQQDEAYSNIDRRALPASHFRQYVSPRPNRTLWESIQSVIQKVYVFPPFYPVLSLLWTSILSHRLDNTLVIQRSLTALFGCLSIAGMYCLGWELFKSQFAALISATLIATSPFHFQYSQILRPYSTLTMFVVLSSACLLKSLNSQRFKWWSLYTLSLITGLYAHILFAFMMISHTLYVAIINKFRLTQAMFRYCIASGLGALFFLPWFLAFLNSHMLAYSVSQVANRDASAGLIRLFVSWIRALKKLFIDFYNPWFSPTSLKLPHNILGILIILIVLAAFVSLLRSQNLDNRVKVFILSLLFAGGVILMINDLKSGSTISTRMRYLIPYAIALELMVATWLKTLLQSKSARLRRYGTASILVVLLSGAFSCLAISQAPSWDAFGSPNFPEAAAIIRNAEKPIVIATNLDRILSMSFLVDSDTNFKLVRDDMRIPEGYETVLLLEPSDEILTRFQQIYIVEEKGDRSRLYLIKQERQQRKD